MKNILFQGVPKKIDIGTGEYRHILSQVTDISNQEGIRLEIELLEQELSEIEVTLYPLHIGRPEFFPCVFGVVAVAGKGKHFVDIPFEQFEFWQMTRAFLNYLDSISVRLVRGGAIILKSIESDTMGDFTVCTDETSKAGDTEEWVKYSLFLYNKVDRERVINIHQSKYGRECLPVEYEHYITLSAYEKKEYIIKVKITEDIPAGGLEKSSFLFVPDGDGTQVKQILLQTAKKRAHPYLFLTENQWQKRKTALLTDKELYRAFYKEYVETAEKWEVPAVSEREDHVYPAYSQNELFKTAVAWKITEKETYLQKVIKYFDGLTEKEKGYLNTQKSYFEFIESREEYARGDFKVCRAQSAGWVQEAEFFNKVAISYDLIYPFFTVRQHRNIEECFKNYMKFSSWRLTDGDGNNFQIAECGAGLLCAMALQNQEMIDRFLYQYNGFMELLSSVLLDDGMYFEEATGYVKLAGELFFDIANAAENYGISLKDLKVPASYDRNILHSPWSVREKWAEDKKPFLGMSFERFEKFSRTTRTIKDYFDCTAKLLTDKGVMFSVNDSNEQSFTELYKKAYYLYKEPLYKQIAELSPVLETLLVPEEEEEYILGQNSLLLSGAGFGILRDKTAQAVLKFGGHGGYHGHYDRLSLASFLKDNQTFHNNEYTWYGYQSFLFKMWVQTSVAHNMTVVDGRMQKPSPCECIYFAAHNKICQSESLKAGNLQEKFFQKSHEFSAVCAQTTTVWIDPPYGGQTPYPLSFPDEKCEKEGRFILKPEKVRKQGEIGEYSEPVFQRRLLILFHGYCIVWDYLEGQEIHRYDCLYHPVGTFENEGKIMFSKKDRFLDDPFGSGQFIQNCYTAEARDVICLYFHKGISCSGPVETMPESAVWKAWPLNGSVTLGRYPQREDSFTEENRKDSQEYLNKPEKKTVSFTTEAKTAEFITILEAGKQTGGIKAVSCKDFQSIVITETTKESWEIFVMGMNRKDAQISVKINKVSEEQQ